LSLFVVVIVMVCNRHCHCLWPSLFVAVIAVAVIVMVCGRNRLWPSLSNPIMTMTPIPMGGGTL